MPWAIIFRAFSPFNLQPTHVGCYGLKRFSTFVFTAASILISDGQGRLKPSPGTFSVASMPSLLPLAISVIAWPSTSGARAEALGTRRLEIAFSIREKCFLENLVARRPTRVGFWKGCKPNSVCPACAGERIICLSGQYPKPGWLAPALERAAPRVSYWTLHPMGFSVPRRLRLERWALTPPFHPYPGCCQPWRYNSLWHFPSGRLAASPPACIPRALRSGVTRHRALWCSDFPPPARAGSDSPPFQNQRPAGNYGAAGAMARSAGDWRCPHLLSERGFVTRSGVIGKARGCGSQSRAPQIGKLPRDLPWQFFKSNRGGVWGVPPEP